MLGDVKLMLFELVPLTLDMKFSKGGGCTPCLFGVDSYYLLKKNDDCKEECSNRLQNVWMDSLFYLTACCFTPEVICDTPQSDRSSMTAQ